MSRIVQRADALRGRAKIAEFIGRDSARAALRFLAAAERAFASLAAMPGKGGLWESDRPQSAGVRVSPIPRFKKDLIIYRPIVGGIEVVHVIHSARDLDNLL
jgi:toxin ParE1/3/4